MILFDDLIILQSCVKFELQIVYTILRFYD